MASERSLAFLPCFVNRLAAATPRSFSACCRTASDSDVPRPAKANNSAHVSPADRPSSQAVAANSSATSSQSSLAMLTIARGSPSYRRSRSTTNVLHSPGSRMWSVPKTPPVEILQVVESTRPQSGSFGVPQSQPFRTALSTCPIIPLYGQVRGEASCGRGIRKHKPTRQDRSAKGEANPASFRDLLRRRSPTI